MENYSEIIRIFLHIGIVFLAITMIICLIRAVRGPKLADRIVATNMICVKTILLIVMVAMYIGEGFLVDIALVYSLLSFLAVIVLTRFMLKVKINKAKEGEK
jgi:multicomponent Na+:H+ antiporter subunit F